MSQAEPKTIRTLFVSDVHLGCKHSRSEDFLAFIQGYRPQSLYLVGDFLDDWKVNKRRHWTPQCDAVIDHLARMAAEGTSIFYTPGNHDAFLRQETFRDRLPERFPEVELCDEFIYETLNGWRFLVTHGDLFDVVEAKAQWISRASSSFYDNCLSLNRWVQRRFMNEKRNPYGVCAVAKGRVKRGVKFISRYQKKIMRQAQNRGCDGVICGHIHTPVIKQSRSVLYCNTGDWVENCTGLVEHLDGELQLVRRYGRTKGLHLPKRDSAGGLANESRSALLSSSVATNTEECAV